MVGVFAADNTAQIVVLSGLLVVMVLVGAGVLMVLRRRLLGDPEDGDALGGAGGVSLSALRAMRDRGDLEEEEYEAARRALIDRARSREENEIAAARRRAGGADVSGAAEDRSGSDPEGDGTRRAAPGFDLTGEPLPEAGGDEGEEERG